jgi:hypothetical protein
MPTPVLDPDLGAMVKSNGYKVVVTDSNCNVTHRGSSTARPGGRNYLYYLTRNFTRWWNFWEPQAAKVFELYSGKPVQYRHDEMEISRSSSQGTHGDLDKDFDVIPPEYEYKEI